MTTGIRVPATQETPPMIGDRQMLAPRPVGIEHHLLRGGVFAPVPR